VLKLPKDLVADPRHDAVFALLTNHAGLLWDGGRNQVATLPMTDALAMELRGALSAEHACHGLELITHKLASEQKGLDAVAKKAPESPQNARASRILFLARFDASALVRFASNSTPASWESVWRYEACAPVIGSSPVFQSRGSFWTFDGRCSPG
jgi:hypothetical protein